MPALTDSPAASAFGIDKSPPDRIDCASAASRFFATERSPPVTTPTTGVAASTAPVDSGAHTVSRTMFTVPRCTHVIDPPRIMRCGMRRTFASLRACGVTLSAAVVVTPIDTAALNGDVIVFSVRMLSSDVCDAVAWPAEFRMPLMKPVEYVASVAVMTNTPSRYTRIDVPLIVTRNRYVVPATYPVACDASTAIETFAAYTFSEMPVVPSLTMTV